MPYGDSDSIYGKASQIGLDKFNSPMPSPKYGHSPADSPSRQSQLLYDMNTPGTSPGSRNMSEYFQAGSARPSPQGSRQHTPLPSFHDLQQIYLNEGPRNRASLASTVVRGTGIPADEQLAQDVYDIVRAADLTVMSKRSVREELQNLYGVSSLGERTAMVNRLIEGMLSALCLA